jgi:NAD/NADP transhydrogenase alpha subunit
MNYALIAVYIAAMTTANLLVWWLGPWFSPINAFFLIGLDLTLRDVMQERLGRWQIAGVIIAGGALTWLLNPSASHIAIASATAFTVSAAVDWAVYSWLKPRPWMIRSNGSNVVGAAVDSILFPTLAFGSFMPMIVALQFAAKVCGGAVWSLVLGRFVRRFA